MPLVLAKGIGAFAADVRRRQCILEVSVRSAEQEARKVVSRAHDIVGVEIQFAIQVVAIDQIFLIRREAGAELPVVFPVCPRKRVRPRECVFDVARGAVFAGTNLKPVVEKDIRRTRGKIGSNVDAKLRAGRQLVYWVVREEIRAVHNEMKFIEQGRSKNASVAQVDEVIILLIPGGEARNAGGWRGV